MSRYSLYLDYRRCNTPAAKAYSLLVQDTGHDRDWLQTWVDSIIRVVIGVVTFSIAKGLFRDNHRPITPETVWIESPSSKTTTEFPFFQGARIVRKHGWEFAVVQPIQPPRVITRREALSILLHGDKLGVI